MLHLKLSIKPLLLLFNVSTLAKDYILVSHDYIDFYLLLQDRIFLVSLLKKLLFMTQSQLWLSKNRRRLYSSGNFVNIVNISKTAFAKPSLNNVKQKWFSRNRLCFTLFKDGFVKTKFVQF